MRYEQLLKGDDCDSLDQCKRLNGAALALIFTVAMRCLPSLTYLDKVRQLMVDLEDGKAGATVVKHAIFLSREDCTVPNVYGVDAPNVDDFVPPQTLCWYNTWPLCLEFLTSSKIDVKPLITHRFGFTHKEGEDAFETSARGSNAIKVMFNL
ncbi:hypothetical protein Bca4012_010639 [Brassica carinata]|uniref:Uncharacterized protein n=1 Tax=Brassica carinata TaxID=52824 RepID=A0A8X7S7S9_BRACI|nr:hypothetical protein Bca52824_035551 [Brassica carinata]